MTIVKTAMIHVQ